MSRPTLIGWVVTQYDTHYKTLQQYSNPGPESQARKEARAISAHTDGVLKYGVARLWRRGESLVLELIQEPVEA